MMASGSGRLPADDSDRIIWQQKPLPGYSLLETFVEEEFRPEDRPQASLAFATAQKLRFEQRRLLVQQQHHLDKANECGFAAAGIEQYVHGQEMIVVDLRSRLAPTYGMPERREVRRLNVEVNTASEALRFAIPPIETVLEQEAERRKETDAVSPSCSADAAEQSARSSALESGVASMALQAPVDPVPVAPQVSGVSSSSVELSAHVTGEATKKKSIAWTDTSISKKILGRDPFPYPPALKADRYLPDGHPAFEFRQIFALLPEQIGLVLELDTKYRYGCPTKFVLDPTINYNILQFKTVDERVGEPDNRDGVKQRPIREVYISWSSKLGACLEWGTDRVLIRRWVDSRQERDQFLEVPIAASISNSRGMPVNLQVLGAPFAERYVKGFVLFSDTEGAIAVKVNDSVEWWPFRSVVGKL